MIAWCCLLWFMRNKCFLFCAMNPLLLVIIELWISKTSIIPVIKNIFNHFRIAGFLYLKYILEYFIMSFFQFETENFVLWLPVCHIMLIFMLKINFTLKTIIWKSINRNRIDGPKLDIQTNNTFFIFTSCTKPHTIENLSIQIACYHSILVKYVSLKEIDYIYI